MFQRLILTPKKRNIKLAQTHNGIKMSDITAEKKGKTSNNALDILVILFCIGGAVASLYYFYRDFYASFRSLNIVPAGTVTVKYNTVQRRLADRAVWDRLFAQSPVYNGDLVHIARLSGAILNIDENNIELGENTLIRINKDADSLNLNFSYGNINLSTGANSKAVSLTIGNQIVQIPRGAGINAVSNDDGLVLRVTEGAAQFIIGGQSRNVSAGEVIVRDADGGEVRRPMTAVVYPKPNANYLKTDARPLGVEFKWTRINLHPQDVIRLELASDKNFTRIIHAFDNLDSGAVVPLNAGTWHWRLLQINNTLASGRLTVTEAPAPVLITPTATATAQIPVKIAGQEVQFRWAEVPNVEYYNLQISRLQDFSAPEINVQLQTTNYINSDMDPGTWYWRVIPVFPNDYEGQARSSQTSSFQIRPAFVPVIAAPEPVQEQPAVAVIAAVAEEDIAEQAFAALREETRRIWQEQQVQREQQALQEQRELERAQQARRAQEQRAQQAQREQQAQRAQQARQAEQARREQQAQRAQTRQTEQVSTAVQTPPRQERRNQQTLYLTLISPAQNTVIPGLTAINQPTIFNWDTDEELEFSRFVLSRNANPVSGRPEIDIQNPGRTVAVPRIAEGVWYWTVEGRTRDGNPIIAASPRQISVQPVPLLPAPRNRLPSAGFNIGAEEIRKNQGIEFSWAPVEGANFYILSILKDGFFSKPQIFQTELLSELTYTLNDFTVLDDSGTFFWQVEAVFCGSDGILEQRGRLEENKFSFEVPRPGRVRTKRTGVLYGR
jgi:hypothetical protein